ncbi:hypothetical protein [Rhodococcus sp. LB1]|uniref:hypothetical protein n=1 Tax=Rhodococcus sp. LB1 TaxID=1807499 RepID=UPI00077AD933|nr:hypothetical protein [Rhodococcus sp. LB1]KXX54562.1 hypothetical protein AZG88_03055 [Rhodococcus sp. LB1]
MTNPFYPNQQGPKPGQLGQPSPGQGAKPPKTPKPPIRPPGWNPEKGNKPLWPWLLGGGFSILVLTLGIAANVQDDTTSSAAVSSTKAAATTTLSAAEFKRQSEARAAEAERQRLAQEEKVRAAEAERARVAAIEAARWDRNTYESLGERDFALVAKNPDANKGRKLVVYGHVTQFDSATGTTQFRANTMASPQDRSYSYDNNTVVTGAANVLANVVEDDFVTMYVEVTGSHSYSTTMGGSTTVPKFQAIMIDVTGSSE